MEILEVYRDHLEECLVHFSKRFREKVPSWTKGVSDIRKSMADFCGVADNTLRRWMSDEPVLPCGEKRFMLICFLVIHGYKIIEFERLASSSLRNMTELIGFGVLPAKTISERVGYGDTQTLYDVLNEKKGASERVLETMREIWKEKRGELDQKKKDAFENSRLRILTEVSQEKKLVQLSLITGAEKETSQSKSALSIMRGLLGLMETEVFENLSPEDATNLEHDVAMILDLSARLSALGSKIISAKGR